MSKKHARIRQLSCRAPRQTLIAFTACALFACGKPPHKLAGVAPLQLAYKSASLRLVKATAMEPLAPQLMGASSARFEVSPALPLGLQLDQQTGVLSGAPQASAAAQTFRIAAHSTDQSTSFDLEIEVLEQAPQTLSYATNPAFYPINIAIASNTPNPTEAGAAFAFTVTPTLPRGLTLDAANGVIAGTPTEATPLVAYTVSAKNTHGAVQGALQMRIDESPKGFGYTLPVAQYIRTVAITDNTPVFSAGGSGFFSVAPPLPPGLTLDAQTGIISGAAQALSNATVYEMTVTNTAGTATTTVSIEVILECQGTCGAAPGEGWSAPLIVKTEASSVPAGCDGSYPTEVMLANADLQVPASCICACKPRCNRVAYGYTDNVCTTDCVSGGACRGHSWSGDDCLNVSLTEAFVRVVSPPTTACVVAASSRPPVTWGSQGRLCGGGGAAMGACAASTSCFAAAPSGTRLCVWRSTSTPDAVACPAGYASRKVYYEGYTDDRVCAACDCATPGVGTASCAVNELKLYSQAGCTGAQTALAENSCQPSGAASSIKLSHTVTGSCGGDGQPMPYSSGSVVPTNPTVVCCQ